MTEGNGAADEFDVMKQVSKLLDSLKPDAQQRAVLYLETRYVPDLDDIEGLMPGAMPGAYRARMRMIRR